MNKNKTLTFIAVSALATLACSENKDQPRTYTPPTTTTLIINEENIQVQARDSALVYSEGTGAILSVAGTNKETSFTVSAISDSTTQTNFEEITLHRTRNNAHCTATLTITYMSTNEGNIEIEAIGQSEGCASEFTLSLNANPIILCSAYRDIPGEGVILAQDEYNQTEFCQRVRQSDQ